MQLESEGRLRPSMQRSQVIPFMTKYFLLNKLNAADLSDEMMKECVEDMSYKCICTKSVILAIRE